MKIILIVVMLFCGMFVSAQQPEEPFYESGNAFVRFCYVGARRSVPVPLSRSIKMIEES
jgi:hypothetical protein